MKNWLDIIAVRVKTAVIGWREYFLYSFFTPPSPLFARNFYWSSYTSPQSSRTEYLMDILWCVLLVAFYLLVFLLALGCGRLSPRR